MARTLRAIRTLVLSAALLTATATANPAAEAPDPELRAVLMTAVEISESFEDRYAMTANTSSGDSCARVASRCT